MPPSPTQFCHVPFGVTWPGEALHTSASLMAVEQAALASWMVQAWVVLASLTITKQTSLASRVTQEHVALVS